MRSLWTLRWMFVHVGVLVLVAAFLALGWWQVGRAASGNLLSYGYAVQWPIFAGFVAYVWIKEMRRVGALSTRDSAEVASRDNDQTGIVRRKGYTDSEGSTGSEGSTSLKGATRPNDAADSPATHRRRLPPRLDRAAPAYDDRDNPELAAYNHYLEWLNANPHASPSKYPGRA